MNGFLSRLVWNSICRTGPQLSRKSVTSGMISSSTWLHDIPNTVGQAMRGLAGLDIQMINVHAAGGSKMMRAALDGLQQGGSRAQLIAVTQLTSTSEEMMNREQGIPGSINDSIVNYARVTRDAGLAGVVCSANESALIRDALGEAFPKVTPGIRTLEDAQGDQVRIATPGICPSEWVDPYCGRSLNHTGE